jgi:hypothetical protein
MARLTVYQKKRCKKEGFVFLVFICSCDRTIHTSEGAFLQQLLSALFQQVDRLRQTDPRVGPALVGRGFTFCWIWLGITLVERETKKPHKQSIQLPCITSKNKFPSETNKKFYVLPSGPSRNDSLSEAGSMPFPFFVLLLCFWSSKKRFCFQHHLTPLFEMKS